MKLIAKTEILYHSHMYGAGDELPQNDQAMVKAWLKAGTAEYEDQIKKTAAPVLEMAERILNEKQEKAEVPTGRKKIVESGTPDCKETGK